MDIYQERREWLQQQLDDDCAVVLVGNREQIRNKNIHFRFRQDHDFYYFTGFDEPDAVAIIRPGHAQPYVLFVQPKDEMQEVWFAARTGVNGVIEQLNADAAYSIHELETVLPKLLESRRQVYWSDELDRFGDRIFDWMNHQRKNAKFDETKIYRNLHSALAITQSRRPVKDKHEIQLIRHAVNASSEAHKTLMQTCRPGLSEQQMAAEFYHEVSKLGCNDVGYPTILAGGNNACCLHYDVNKDVLKDGDLVLVDAGGDFQYYTADITRTYPVNGVFSPEQRDVYQVVLEAIDTAISYVKPGASWSGIYPAAMEVITRGLLDLKILKGSFDEAWETEAYKPFTLHKTGHWMGLDVHDVGSYREADGEWRKLQENMVFTIEPGLYFPKGSAVDEKWQGMGVRIEDDILVTKTGCENLSASVPRTIEEIESIMKKN